ncbi:MAG TPA: ABC transporter permease [Actinomycetota bacterium]|nr:ABC transporter permease [Actinomycetota bacterium]
MGERFPIRRAIRLVIVDWIFTLKEIFRSAFFVLVAALQPVIFATIAFFMFKSGARGETLLYAALGAALMGIWSSTLFGSGGQIQWERFQGTLEPLLVAPRPYVLTVTGAALGTSTMGLYSLVTTLLWGRLLFGIPLDVERPGLFLLAIPITIFGLGMLGLVLASTFVLYRHANALSNLLEYPVWLITGLLVPVSLLPGWVEPLSWVLAPTWGIKAIRGAALGQGDPAFAIAMAVLLAVIYIVIGSVFLRYFEVLARERATLALT